MNTTLLRRIALVAAFAAATVCAQAYQTQQNANSAVGNFNFWYQNWIGAATTDINNSGASQTAKDDALAVLDAMGNYASDPGNFDWGSSVPFSIGGADGTIICYYDWENDQWFITLEINW